MVILGVAVGCGRVGFSPKVRADAARAGDAASPGDSSGDASGDAGTECLYLATCVTGQVTCCDGTGPHCIPAGTLCAGTFAECDFTTNAPCDVGAACCRLAADPAGRCYGPFPAPPC
jgi:hypothetical protein